MFYVLAALRAELRSRGAFGDNGDPDLRPLLDLVALGTVADVVRLDDNNRILVAQGLARIRAGLARPGIDALFRVAGCDPRQASASDLGFRIGPRLNAAGRLEDMSLGVRCLLSENPQEAASLAAELQAINDARRDIQSDMQAQADALLGTIDCHMQAALCVFHPDWHAGVVGILASRLKERHHRPVVAFARGDNGELKGSGRSLPALHLRDALDWIDREHPGLILKFGGHAMAAGLSLREADLPRFCAAFEQLAQSRLSPADLAECWETDGELAPGELTPSTAELLENAVWGQGFPPPSFTGEFRVVQQQVVGEKHLRVQLEGDSGRWEAMAFFHADPLPDTVQAHYTPMLNRYQGQTRVQLKLLGWT
jgi:single-stranded-DNA-specific exonuclease